MLPLDTLTPDVANALKSAFGDLPLADVTVLKGGRSGATLLSLNVDGKGYVLRRCDPSRPEHEPRIAREFTCMQLAAARGVAPALLFADAAAGISIMARIETPPVVRDARRITRVAAALRHLHEGPAFPPEKNAIATVRYFDETLREQGRAGLPALLLETLNGLADQTQRFNATAPCHGDLNPGNILDAPENIYFIDWDTACQADPFFDLAQLGVFAFPQANDRAALLEAYVGHAPNAEERARMTLARVMALGFYAAAFIQVSLAGGGTDVLPSQPLALPELFAQFVATQGNVAPLSVAGALLEAMRGETLTEAFREAQRVL